MMPLTPMPTQSSSVSWRRDGTRASDAGSDGATPRVCHEEPLAREPASARVAAVETPRDLAVLICPLPLSLLDALDEHAQVEGIDRAAAVRALLTEALDVHRIARAV